MAELGPMGWAPERMRVLVVGLLSWAHPDLFSAFPEEQRRDGALVDYFRRAGVPEARMTYLKDRAATTAAVSQALEAALTASAEGDLLLLYFAGHGGKTEEGAAYFATYDTDCEANLGWQVASIPPLLAGGFRGARAVLMADCCYSGSLAEALAAQAGLPPSACFASSLASELSTGNWTFTEQVLAALRGQAWVDADGDRHITWAELGRQITDSMAFAEEQLATVSFQGGFDPEAPLARARPRTDPRLGQRLEVRSEGAWYPAEVIAVDGPRLKVHYYGYEDADDEWVTVKATRTAVRPMYAVGTPVEVRWKQRWFPARVLDIRLGIHQIRYDGYGPEWDEWVSQARLRPRP